MHIGREQAGFNPGAVMEINVGLAVPGVAAVIPASLTSSDLKPSPLDAKSPGLAAVAFANWRLPTACLFHHPSLITK